ncbi:MAG: polyprenyl synthetase family protein [Clostridia bacterium]|nr:polyprenyl synthetase family protein [Clostridia bacterium]
MDFQVELNKKIKLVDEALDQLMPTVDANPVTIHKAMRYSIFAGGKRLRPVLVMAAAEALGVDGRQLLPVACAMELIHTYSLIHDDLPSMDNDDYRRGKLTNHKIYGEGVAILAGDGLLTLAFQLMAQKTESGYTNEKAILRAITEVAVAACTLGMIGGQVADIEAENKVIDGEALRSIHARKTGALYRASLRSGAILAGATEGQLGALTKYAEALGLAFQITDDVLDIEGDESKLGKKVGSDIKNNKATYPALYGLETSKQMAAQAVEEALGALAIFGPEADLLREIVKYIIKREI